MRTELNWIKKKVEAFSEPWAWWPVASFFAVEERERDASLRLSTPELTKSKQLHYLVCMCRAWPNACSTKYDVETATSRSQVFCHNSGKRWPWGHTSHAVITMYFIRTSQLIDKLYYLVYSSGKTAKLSKIAFSVTFQNKISEKNIWKKASKCHKEFQICLYWQE